MPALYLFHRRTILGGDDLQPAAFFTATLRVCQLLFLLGPILFHVSQEIIMDNNNSDGSGDDANDENDDFFTDDDFSNDDSTSSSNASCHLSRRRLTKYNHYYLGFLLLYALFSTIYNLATLFLLERPLSHWSSLGAPTETQPRSTKVAQLLEFKLLYASLLLFGIWIVGVMATALAPHYYHCQRVLLSSSSSSQQPAEDYTNRILEEEAMYQNDASDSSSSSSNSSHHSGSSKRYYWTMLAPTIILLATQLAEVIVSWTYLIHLCAQPREDVVVALLPPQHAPEYESGGDAYSQHSSLQPPAAQQQTTHNHELVEEMWAERCATACQCLGIASCFVFGGRELLSTTGAGTALIGQPDFGEIARALADYLETRGVLDVVPSDIVTGFIVLQQLQKQRLLEARRAVLNDLNQQEEEEEDATGTTTTTNRQNSLLMGNPSNSSHSSSGSGRRHRKRNVLSSSQDEEAGVGAAGVTVTGDHLHEDSLFVPLDSPPTSGKNTWNKSGVHQRPQKSSTGGSSSSNTPTMAYHLSSSSTPRRSPHTRLDDSGGGGCYQAFTSPTSGEQQQQGKNCTTGTSANSLDNNINWSTASGSPAAAAAAAARVLLQRNNFTDMIALEEGARYAKYALAIYTWVLYLYVHPVTGVFRLAGHAACSACTTSSTSASSVPVSPRDPRIVTSTIDESGRIEGDNLCHAHRSALLLAAGGLPTTELVYAQLKSRFNQNPYCILLDHEWRNVVVSIRGTFSLEDCITDVLIDPESLEKLGNDFGFDATNQYCHGGVFACARNIYRDLERHGLLDQLLLPQGNGDPARYPDYNLRLVGHSLGSATCTLLSFLLRPKFPNLKCLNYCPVGCCLTWEMATACQDWCTSFVLDSDIVPRLSVESMEVLRDEILDLIARIKVNKVEVAKRLVGGGRHKRSYACSNICFNFPTEDDDEEEEEDDDGYFHDEHDNDPENTRRRRSDNLEDLLYPPDQVPDTDYTRRLAQFKVIQEERRSTRALRNIKLYPPGKLVHLVKTGEKRACIHGIAKCLTCCTTNVGFVYTPVWIKNDDLDEIVVNPHMGTDHFPNRIASVLENVATEFGLNA